MPYHMLCKHSGCLEANRNARNPAMKIGRGNAWSDFICQSSRTSSYDQSASMNASKNRTSCGRPSICFWRSEGNASLLAEWLQNQPSNRMKGFTV